MAKSTKIIAGLGAVAGLGMVFMPLATYAATDYKTITDTINVTVASSCKLMTGDEESTNTTVNPAASVNRGGVIDFGANKTHAFVIDCNVGTYKVTAVASDLNLKNAGANVDHKVIAFEPFATYSEESTAIGNDGKWTAQLTGGDTDAAITKSTSVIKSGASSIADTFSVTYKGYVGKQQAAGTYEGTVIYTLTAPNE